jgi:hypothetical protein
VHRARARIPAQRQGGRQLDDLLDREGHEATGTGNADHRIRIPIDRRPTGELKQAAALEVDEQQAGAGIRDEVADRVEVVVAGVVGEYQRVAVDLDESRVAAAVGGIHAERGALALAAVPASDEEGIGRGDPCALRWGEAVAPGGFSRRGIDTAPSALMNVLGTVAEGLLDREDERSSAVLRDAAVDAVAPARGELDAKDTDVASRLQGTFERVAGNRPRIDGQRARIGRGHESVRPGKHGDPGMPLGIACRDDQEGQCGVKGPVLLGQTGPHHLARPILDIADSEAFLDPPLAGMKGGFGMLGHGSRSEGGVQPAGAISSMRMPPGIAHIMCRVGPPPSGSGANSIATPSVARSLAWASSKARASATLSAR